MASDPNLGRVKELGSILFRRVGRGIRFDSGRVEIAESGVDKSNIVMDIVSGSRPQLSSSSLLLFADSYLVRVETGLARHIYIYLIKYK